MKLIKNMAFSVRERLKNKSNPETAQFNEILNLYAMERLLYRISRSEYSDRFILKGALLFTIWRNNNLRLTKDIDLLGRLENSEENIRKVFRNILNKKVEDDGIKFFSETICTALIKHDAEYHGVRVTFHAKLDTARIDMQVDVGFNDLIYPPPQKVEFPVILDFPKPVILSYSKETAIAEKFEAMTTLGILNSRMKDFYDIWLLSRNFTFEMRVLSESLQKTFKHRNVILDGNITAFSNDFSESKAVQWKAFRKKIRQNGLPESFSAIISVIKNFIVPAIYPIDQTLKWDPEKSEWL